MNILAQRDDFVNTGWNSSTHTRTCDDGSTIVTDISGSFPLVAALAGLDLNPPANAVNEVRAFGVADSAGSGTFAIYVEGKRTLAITYSALFGTLITNINNALDAAFGAGNIVATGGSLGAIILTFSGGSYAGRTMISCSSEVLTGSGFTINGVATVNVQNSCPINTQGGNSSHLYGFKDRLGATMAYSVNSPGYGKGLGLYFKFGLGSVAAGRMIRCGLDVGGSGITGHWTVDVEADSANAIDIVSTGDGPPVSTPATAQKVYSPLLLGKTVSGYTQTDLELWWIIRQLADSTHAEVEMWYASEQTKFCPTLYWKYGHIEQLAPPGGVVSWQIQSSALASGSVILKKVMFDPGSGGVPHPLIDPMQGSRRTYALLGFAGDASPVGTNIVPMGGSRGASVLRDSNRGYDFTLSHLQFTDPAIDSKVVLYVNKNDTAGSSFVKQQPGGLDLFDIDATHQYPGILLFGPANGTLTISQTPSTNGQCCFGTSKDIGSVPPTGGTTIATINCAHLPLASGRGTVTNATTIGTVAADLQSHVVTGTAVISWWTGSVVKAVSCTISGISGTAVTVGSITAITSGTSNALPATATPVFISCATTNDWMYQFWTKAALRSGDWRALLLCDPNAACWQLAGVATVACDPTSAPNGLIINKTDLAQTGPLVQLGNGDILAFALRTMTWDVYASRYRRLAAGADILTGWGAETRVFENETQAISITGALSSGAVGLYDLTGATHNGYPVRYNYSYGLYLYYLTTGAWAITTVAPADPDSIIAISAAVSWSSSDGITYAPNANASGTLTAISHYSTTSAIAGGPCFGIAALPDGKLAMPFEFDTATQQKVYVALLDPSQTYMNQATALGDATAIYTGFGLEPAAAKLPNGDIAVLSRANGFAHLARLTYTAGALAWDTTLGSSGTITCDGSSSGPLLIDGGSSVGVVVYGSKLLAILNNQAKDFAGTGATFARMFLQIMECPVAAVFGGAGVGNQWTESALSPLYDAIGSGATNSSYSPAMQALSDGSIIACFSASFGVYFTQYNKGVPGVGTGSGGGSGSTAFSIPDDTESVVFKGVLL